MIAMTMPASSVTTLTATIYFQLEIKPLFLMSTQMRISPEATRLAVWNGVRIAEA